jgi:PilZ domain
MDRSDTIFSFSDEPPRALHGEGDGDRGRLQPGSVAHGSLREICFVRRIGPVGALLCMDHPPAPGARLDLDLLTGDRLTGIVERVEGSDVSLRFDEPADMFAIIARNLVKQPGDARRMPRIEVSAAAWLEAGSRREVVKLRNISDGGARIETRVPLVVHEQVVLTLDNFRPAPGIVRWVQGNAAGIAFTPELPWHELMPWLRRRHRPRVASAAKASITPPTDVAAAPPREEKGDVTLSIAARVREGSRRWAIEVESIDTRQISFRSYAGVDPGRLFWITLPGLEGWPARVVSVDGYSITCAFTQPLHPAVLERVLSSRRG